MAVDILNVLREKRLKAIHRGETYSNVNEQKTRDMASQVKKILTGEVSQEHLAEEYQVRNLYYKMVGEYSAKKLLTRSSEPLTPRGVSLWRRVATCAKESGVDVETYMRAQFKWFHEAFKRAPELHQLTTEAAVERAKNFTGNAKAKVIGNDIRADVGIADILRRCEKQMQDIMRAQGITRVEVYQRLVMTGMISFPPEFLKADPAYRKATGT